MNKIVVPQKLLVEALAIVKRCVTRSTLPILSQVKLTVNPGELALTCTNLDQEIHVTIPAKDANFKHGFGMKGGGCVKASTLHDIVKSLPELDAMCEVGLLIEEQELKVTSHESAYALGILPADDFPPSTAMDETDLNFSLPQGKLLGLLASTSPAMSEDDSRYVLCSALLEIKDDLKCVTTDGRRLAMADASTDGRATKLSLILPRFAVGELLALLSPDEERAVSLEVTDKAARFCLVDCSPMLTVRFTTKLLEGNYPNYQQVLVKPAHQATVNRAQLLAAVQRVGIIADDLLLSLAAGELTLKGTNRAKELPAKAQEVLPAQHETRARIRLNCDYLADALAAVNLEEVVLRYTDGLSAVVVASPDGHWQTLIMPMRQAEEEKVESAKAEEKNDGADDTSPRPSPQSGEGESVDAPVSSKTSKKKQRVVTGEQVEAAREQAEENNQRAKLKQSAQAHGLTEEEEAAVQLAIKAISENGKCSVSLLQRWLKLSYSAANDVLDELQQRAIVGPTIKEGKNAGTQPVLISLPK